MGSGIAHGRVISSGLPGLLRFSKSRGAVLSSRIRVGGDLQELFERLHLEQKEWQLRSCLKTLDTISRPPFPLRPGGGGGSLGWPGRPPRREAWRSNSRPGPKLNWPPLAVRRMALASFSRFGLHGLEDQRGSAFRAGRLFDAEEGDVEAVVFARIAWSGTALLFESPRTSIPSSYVEMNGIRDVFRPPAVGVADEAGQALLPCGCRRLKRVRRWRDTLMFSSDIDLDEHRVPSESGPARNLFSFPSKSVDALVDL